MNTPKVRRRLDPAERRAQILEVALELFEKQSFSTVSLRQIATACDVNIALLYHYFESRDDLVRAALRHSVDLFVTYFSAQPPRADQPLGRASDWLDATISSIPQLLRMVRLMSDYAAAEGADAQAAEVITDFYRRERETFESSIRLGIAEGRFRHVDPARTARIASMTLDGVFFGGVARLDSDYAGNIADLHSYLVDYLTNP
jgi:AcrR family transcriptional regulator